MPTPSLTASGDIHRGTERALLFCGDKNTSRPVSRVLSGRARKRIRDGHSSGVAIAGSLKQPTRMAGVETHLTPSCLAPGHPYSVLLPVGFTLPATLPPPRCALTAPFHPCCHVSSSWRRRTASAVCFLWHFPWGRPRRLLAATVFPWSPDFPPLAGALKVTLKWPDQQRPSSRLVTRHKARTTADVK